MCQVGCWVKRAVCQVGGCQVYVKHGVCQVGCVSSMCQARYVKRGVFVKSDMCHGVCRVWSVVRELLSMGCVKCSVCPNGGG